MKAMNRMREKWLTQNLRPNDRADARKSKNVRRGEEFSWLSRKADKHGVSVCVVLSHTPDPHNSKPCLVFLLLFFLFLFWNIIPKVLDRAH